ncbi:formate dehydrogenase iron-sulfur subunit [Desulfobaculum xiamenense]|uniref:Formate dehydrogenase iron-sulfur subunit n=1 Tax=Desulfobaculum xiamenense TaxID=995050 RepID=A0A846QGY3_9BACT|nr:4Fe-4S dicluster domain-containing protein [Desulfobaculum xiamenense]NJB66380.1 formate dehydrogenase iron-sulfur subunit [Desulfobaculum xiamenense]
MEKTFFIDLTRCTACRGCQVACKQWHKLPAEETRNFGSHQNPADLSVHTYKLVRFSEHANGHKVQWLFFPEQCRHCIIAPCKEVADGYDETAILRDETTGAVLFTDRLAAFGNDEKQEVREACPYDIPRFDPETGLMAKCDFCIDRVHNGLLPACVQVCPTGTMNFGDREDMLALAEERLAQVKKSKPNAMLVDPDDVNVIYLVEADPKLYHEFLAADAGAHDPKGITRKQMFAKLLSPLKNLS